MCYLDATTYTADRPWGGHRRLTTSMARASDCTGPTSPTFGTSTTGLTSSSSATRSACAVAKAAASTSSGSFPAAAARPSWGRTRRSPRA
jgi:hypothetical protein